MTTTHEDYQTLTAEGRKWLASLGRGQLEWAYTRTTPPDLGALVAQGLAFRSHYAITITDKGREVLERVS